MKRNFEQWLKTFRKSVANWTYYTNFPKVYNNVNKIKVELNILNSLINSSDIENDFRSIIKEYPKVLKVIPILLAKREREIRVIDKGVEKNYNFLVANYSLEEYITFMHKTGLFNLLENHLISDLTDYVKGVEVGLDTNARKNRTGQAMENIVEEYIVDMGYILNETYFKEMTSSAIYDKFGIKLNLSTTGASKADKRFDFVIKEGNNIYAIEVNFYSSGGSKLNETARSYKMITLETENIENFEFLWITDGKGWNSAKRNLKETFEVLKHLYNINDLENGRLNSVLK